MLSFLLLTSALLFAPTQDLPSSPSEIQTPQLNPHKPAQPVRVDLEGGLRLLMVQDNTLPLVDGVMMLPAGELRDPVKQKGLTALWAEGLRRGGAEAFTGLEFETWLGSHAVELSIEATPDQLRIHFNCLSEDLEGVITHLGQLLTAPALDAKAIEIARNQMLSEVARVQDDSGALADQKIRWLLFGSASPYGMTPTAETLKAIQHADLVALSKRTLGKDRILLGLSGAFEPAAVQASIERAFDELPQLGKPAPLPIQSFQQPERTKIYIVDKPGVTQTELRIAGPGLSITDPDQAKMTLWAYVVGSGGSTNRMMMRVRTDLGLAYSVGAAFTPSLVDTGMFYAFGGTRNDAVAQTLSEMLELILESGAEPIAKQELESARQRYLAGQVFSEDTAVERLERAMALEFNGLPPDTFENYVERIRKTSAKQIQEAVRRTIPPGRFLCVAVGPAEAITRQLETVAEVVSIGQLDALADATPQVETMLKAMGGRAAWAQLETIRIRQDVTVNYDKASVVVEVEQWRRFAPRSIRLRQKSAASAYYTNVVNGDVGQLKSPTGTVPMPPADVSAWNIMLSRWLYYNVHLIAKGDSEVRTGLDDQGRIVILDTLGEVGRITLGPDGLPALYEVRESGQDKAYAYSDWKPYGAYMVATKYVDGIQEVDVLEVAPNEPMDEATFSL